MRFCCRKPRPSGGFTLLEILIVVVILGALAALAIPAYIATTEKAKKQEAYQALTALRESQQRYYAANGTYSNTFTGLDFMPNTTMPGQTAPLFSYFLGTSDATTYTALASRTSSPPTVSGAYTVQIDQAGGLSSNF